METTTKEIVFKTRVTPKLGAIATLPIGAAVALGYFALDAGAKFGPNDPSRILFVGIPAVVAAVLLLSVLLILNHFLGRTITLTADELKYKDSKVQLVLDISEMAFSPASEDATVKTLMFSDGNNFIQIPELFLGEVEFKKLSKYILRKRESKRGADQRTYSL
jgi:hypothetical protein